MAEAARFLAGPPPKPTNQLGAASDLTIDGVLVLGAIGWEPVELVTGISWFPIPRGAWILGKGENAVVTAAHQAAVAAAERRLADQCATAGGHGVVGVQFAMRTEHHHVAVEFVGTAVRPAGAGKLEGLPFTSDLSARDFVVLSRSGWRPVGLCVGVSFVFVPRRQKSGGVRLRRGNYELENYTKSLYNAREQAMERMQSAAIELGGTGIIGTDVKEGPMPFAHHALSFIATGTATRLEADAHLPHLPSLAISLDDLDRAFEARALREP
jgi:uncharacterized protein YbjQ (UPF0145 family)